MICFRAAVLLAAVVIAVPAAAQRRGISDRSLSRSSVERWVQQLGSDLDHLQEDLVYERGTYPRGLREQVDQVSRAVAHFQRVLSQTNDQRHLQRDFQEMDEEVHRLVRTLNRADDSWLRRQASRISYSDEQLHYALQSKVADPRAPSRELLARQAHLLEIGARDLEELAERVNRRDRRLREAIREFADQAEHFHQVVEDGADSQHLHKDFEEVDDTWHRVVELLNRSSNVFYLRSAAQNVNRVHNQIHELLTTGHERVHEHEEVTVPVNPPRSRRPVIEFEIPGVGRFQIPQ